MNTQTEYSADSRRAALRRVRAALEARIAERMLEVNEPLAGNREFGMNLPEKDCDPRGD